MRKYVPILFVPLFNCREKQSLCISGKDYLLFMEFLKFTRGEIECGTVCQTNRLFVQWCHAMTSGGC